MALCSGPDDGLPGNNLSDKRLSASLPYPEKPGLLPTLPIMSSIRPLQDSFAPGTAGRFRIVSPRNEQSPDQPQTVCYITHVIANIFGPRTMVAGLLLRARRPTQNSRNRRRKNSHASNFHGSSSSVVLCGDAQTKVTGTDQCG